MNDSRNEALTSHAHRILAHHGRTFSRATRFLGPEQADRIALLYAFCRRIDDLVDDKPVDEGRLALASVRRDLAAGRSGDATVQGFLDLARARRFDMRVPDELLRGLEKDLGAVRIENEDELVRYAYRVAGTVGLLCCDVFGVDDAIARPFAIDLGIGMQLTNIARDVLEDAARDRIYVPRSWLPRGVSPTALREGRLRTRLEARVAVRRMLSLAERYYRSADHGMRALPPRARMAVLAASRNYEAIGDAIRRQRDGDWGERAVVGSGARLRHTLRAAGSFLRTSVADRRLDPRAHDPALHAPLRGLPGVDERRA